VKTTEELTALFRRRGLRVTPQRQALFRLLYGNDSHPTVECLCQEARAEMPTISLRTVYQAVHDLEALGEVALVDLGTGSVRVDPDVEHPHHHLICTRCGKVSGVVIDIEGLRVPAVSQGFTVTSVQVLFRGACDECGPPVSPGIRQRRAAERVRAADGKTRDTTNGGAARGRHLGRGRVDRIR
jgi:Fe2+ or Zn2+ uptake regulation protein